MLFRDRQLIRQRSRIGEKEPVRAVAGRLDDAGAGPSRGVEDVLRSVDVRLEDAAVRMRSGDRDRRPVDDGVGVSCGDDIERLAAVGEVGGAERDVRRGVGTEARVLVIDDDDLVVARESIDDQRPDAPRPPVTRTVSMCSRRRDE